jgi:hypothetical protein
MLTHLTQNHNHFLVSFSHFRRALFDALNLIQHHKINRMFLDKMPHHRCRIGLLKRLKIQDEIGMFGRINSNLATLFNVHSAIWIGFCDPFRPWCDGAVEGDNDREMRVDHAAG